MKTIILPEESGWEDICRRPSIKKSYLEEKVRAILLNVKSEKDKAVFAYSEKFDGVRLESLKVSPEEIAESVDIISPQIKNAIATARNNIEKFHKAQLSPEPRPGNIQRGQMLEEECRN